MANPARKSAAEHPDEALEILRRLEPVLSRMNGQLQQVQADTVEIRAEQRRQTDVLGKLDDRMRKVETDMARLDGRVSQLPTLWQLAGLIFAIFGAAFVLIRFASGH